MIDCHVHLTADAFDPDRSSLMDRARRAGVAAMLTVTEGPEELTAARQLALDSTANLPVIACFGLHPDRFAEDLPPPPREQIDALIDAIRRDADQLGAIGEIGLDHFRVRSAERRQAQAALLEELAQLGKERGRPLRVQGRWGGRAAIELLRGVGAERVLMHAFDGRAAHAVRAIEHGFSFSVPPSVVRSPQKQKLVRRLPLESLLLESDAPALGPVVRERNEPANISVGRDFIAEAHGVSAERVVEQTTANARRLFPRLDSVLKATEY